MSTTQDAGSQPKRPSLGRHVSASSYISQSPSDSTGHSGSYKARGHKPQKHVVGRLGRNVSFGRDLDKLRALTSSNTTANTNFTPQPEGADSQTHRRSKSGDASAPSSPRPSLVKRNTSTVLMKRNTSHTALRKNLSSGHLPRHGSGKNLAKHGRADAPRMKRTSSDKGKAHRRSRSRSPPAKAAQPTVRFDIGDEENDVDDVEDGWTEDGSTSQSPETTRTNTRANSMIGDSQHGLDGSQESRPPHRREPSDPVVRFAPTSPSPPQSAQRHSLSDSLIAEQDHAKDAQQINGHGSYISAAVRPPDADAITSRLLQRVPSHGAAPQTSMVSASVHAHADNPRILSHSQGSTLGSAETPGKDLVSRFINGPGSSEATPSSSFLPQKQRTPELDNENKRDSETLKLIKRNKSTPNMPHPLSAAASATSHRRSASGEAVPSSTPTDPELNPSRTQQKLWLQRASSTIEPQKMIPSVLPRTAGPPLLTPGVTYSVDSAGRLDPRLQRQFDQVQLEYKAIRRYRNPLAEAIRKLGQCNGVRKDYLTAGATLSGATSATAVSLRASENHRDGMRTPASGLQSGVHSSRASITGSTRNSGAATPARGQPDREVERAETRSHKSRVSFEVPAKSPEEEEAGVEDADVDSNDDDASSTTSSIEPAARHHNDAYEICRRLWDMAASGEGG